MKKTYIIPQVEIHAITVEGLIATSPASPDVTVNPNADGISAGSVEVKGGNDYDVWDDDWSR